MYSSILVVFHKSPCDSQTAVLITWIPQICSVIIFHRKVKVLCEHIVWEGVGGGEETSKLLIISQSNDNNGSLLP